MKYLEPQHMLGLRVMSKKGLDAYDSDFVPAAKLARREGIDFVLDPMRANVEPQLFEHVDGIKSVTPSVLKRIKSK